MRCRGRRAPLGGCMVQVRTAVLSLANASRPTIIRNFINLPPSSLEHSPDTATTEATMSIAISQAGSRLGLRELGRHMPGAPWPPCCKGKAGRGGAGRGELSFQHRGKSDKLLVDAREGALAACEGIGTAHCS